MDDNSGAAAKLFAAWERWDLDAIGALVADDAVDTRPQSGERFTGRANIMGMYQEVPGPPRISWRSIRGGPHVWIAEGTVEYGEGPVHLVGIVEFADGKVVRGDYYFADPFEPPEARARWTGPAAS
jgi:ketosteroid isomerase-like protein